MFHSLGELSIKLIEVVFDSFQINSSISKSSKQRFDHNGFITVNVQLMDNEYVYFEQRTTPSLILKTPRVFSKESKTNSVSTLSSCLIGEEITVDYAISTSIITVNVFQLKSHFNTDSIDDYNNQSVDCVGYIEIPIDRLASHVSVSKSNISNI